MSTKILKEWIAVAQAQGWTITTTGSGHYRWRSPTGDVTTTPGTPGDRKRGMLNTRAALRRMGLKL